MKSLSTLNLTLNICKALGEIGVTPLMMEDWDDEDELDMDW